MWAVEAVVSIPFLGEESFSDLFDADNAPEAAAAALMRWNSLRPITLVSVERVS